tara:strand:+ start:198 stop:422 length:225 start_codon:yes stop_codon:yes gene_type:complete
MDKFFAIHDILKKHPSVSKYTVIFVLREMIRKGLAKSPVDALQKLDDQSVDLTKLFEEEEAEISTTDEEDKKDP